MFIHKYLQINYVRYTIGINIIRLVKTHCAGCSV